MRRAAILTALLVALTALPAAADDGGAASTTWAGHCNSTVILYMHTRATTFSAWITSRLEVSTRAGADGVGRIRLDHMTLWRFRGGWSSVDRIGSDSASLGAGDFNPLFQGGDVSCDTPPGSDVRVGDTVHVEAVYRIFWQDGSSTNLRSDNSRDWDIDSHGDCT